MLDIEESHGTAVRGAGQRWPSRRERHRLDPRLLSLVLETRGSRLILPAPKLSVVRSGDDPPPIAAHGNGRQRHVALVNDALPRIEARALVLPFPAAEVL